jgi:hypothetical protein
MNELELKIIELEKVNKELLILNSELETNVIGLTKKLSFEMRKNIGDKILFEYYQRLFNGATANYLLDPDPKPLQCSGVKTGSSSTYLVQLKNIVAIKSDGRLKTIYLTQPQSPIEGGEKKNIILFNNNDSNWDDLLFELQGSGQFLFRVHKSYAINIFHYTFSEDGIFRLNSKLKKNTNSLVHEVATDSNFNEMVYHKRLIEIKQLFDYQVGFALDYQKLQEISDYIKKHIVTNEEDAEDM